MSLQLKSYDKFPPRVFPSLVYFLQGGLVSSSIHFSTNVTTPFFFLCSGKKIPLCILTSSVIFEM